VRLFLDACVIIYIVEADATFAPRVKRVLARLRAEHPQAVLTVSEISRLECRVRPLREGDSVALGMFDTFFGSGNVEMRPIGTDVIDLATTVRARTSLRTPDSLQAASCLALPPPYRFVTADAAFRRVPGLDVVLV
jgi:predicted nucleic acid-binding protein